jgi:hypothetical protein
MNNYSFALYSEGKNESWKKLIDFIKQVNRTSNNQNILYLKENKIKDNVYSSVILHFQRAANKF